MSFNIPDVNILSILPEIILLIAGTVLLFLKYSPEKKGAFASLAALGILFNLLIIPLFWSVDITITGFDGKILRDSVSLLFQFMIAISVLLVILYSYYYIKDDENYIGEYYGFILYSVIGMNLMVVSRDLLVIFLGMEILSLSLYVLVAFFKDVKIGMEAAIKYFLLGAFASAIFLLGISFFYGVSGQTSLESFARYSISPVLSYSLLFVGVALILVGLGFKIASVPFHMWAPDTYEGAPTSIASLLSVAPKIAGFAVILRICSEMTSLSSNIVLSTIVVMAVSSMIIGNFAALKQSGLVRMLAYSGIAQVGYMLISLLAVPQGGGSALIFYLMVYVFMNMGAFGIAVYLSTKRDEWIKIDDLGGLAARHPLLALTMAVFMISLAGIPPTGGFFAKFYVFKLGIEAGYLWVVLVAIIATIASLYYYLRVVMVMYMREEVAESIPSHAIAKSFSFVMLIVAFVVLIFGIMPGSFISMAIHAITAL